MEQARTVIRTPFIGQRALFYPPTPLGNPLPPAPIMGVVEHVWGESCVNLKLENGDRPSSVLVWHEQHNPSARQPAGYYCVLETEERQLGVAGVAETPLPKVGEGELVGYAGVSDRPDAGRAAPPKAENFMVQPAITGYRKLSDQEAELMNEAKALASKVGELVSKLRQYPATGADGAAKLTMAPCAFDPLGQALKPTIDQRWVSIGATQLQQGFMALVRGIAQPTTF